MAIYEITADFIHPLAETKFSQAGIKERDDLQRLLRKQIEVSVPGVLVIAEEFCEWEDSRRRIDLLGIDKDANLIVFELKRSEDGGHMDLQAIRYAAMVSAMTFDKATEVYARFLQANDLERDSRTELLQFLDWDEANEDLFAKRVKIVLASAEFSQELTSSVMWLNDSGLDIRCVRIKPYQDDGKVLIDVQQILPLPEASDYQVKLREKVSQERVAREGHRDQIKFDVIINGVVEEGLAKRTAILRLITALCQCGIKTSDILQTLLWRGSKLLISTDGKLNSTEFKLAVSRQQAMIGKSFDPSRWFCSDEQLLHVEGKTHAISNQWGESTQRAINELIAAFPHTGINVQTVNES